VGYFFGAVGGYFGGKVDALIMWRKHHLVNLTPFWFCDYFGSW
jgi:ABC-type dipeptide/oligopeptide/nickel transport system permease subunit